MDKEQFLASGLLEQYVLGLTSTQETAQVERWLRQHPELKEEVSAMHDALEKYSLAQGITPPPHLKSKILNTIDAEKPENLLQVEPNAPAAKLIRLSWTRFIWPAVATIALLFTLLRNNTLGHQLRDVQKDLVATKAICEEEAQRFQAFIQHPATQKLVINGVDRAPDLAVVVYWNPVEKLAFLDTSTLPASPEADKQFQIWANVEGEMINLGLLKQAPQDTLLPIAFLEEAESLNITLEPQGGSAHPHVEDLFASSPI